MNRNELKEKIGQMDLMALKAFLVSCISGQNIALDYLDKLVGTDKAEEVVGQILEKVTTIDLTESTLAVFDSLAESKNQHAIYMLHALKHHPNPNIKKAAKPIVML